MRAKSKCCPLVTNVVQEKYTSNFKLMLLLFIMGSFTQVANAQLCNGMSIKESASSTGISNTDRIISFTANLNRPDQAITWTIQQDKTAASFTENKLTVIKKVSAKGPNTVSVNVGPNHGAFTVKLTFDGADIPNTGSCSSSYSF